MNRMLAYQTLELRKMLTQFSPVLLSDFSEGPESSEFSSFHSFGDRIVFNVNSNQVWQSDGTPEGTTKLADTSLQTAFDVELLGPSANGLPVRLFNAFTEGRIGIWRTDGTAEGTFEVVANRRLSANPVDVDGYSLAAVPRIATTELWRIGANQDDTVLLTEWNGIVDLNDVAVVGDVVFINSNGALFRTDGTVDGTQQIADGISDLAGTDEFASFFKTTEDEEIQHYRVDAASLDPTFHLALPVRSYGVENFGEDFMFLRLGDPAVYQDTITTVWVSDGTQDGTIETSHRSEHVMEVVRFEQSVFIRFKYGGNVRSDGTPDGTFQPGSVLGHMGDKVILGYSSDVTGYTTDGETIHPASIKEPKIATPLPTIPPPPVTAYWSIGEDFVKSQPTYVSFDRARETFVLDAEGEFARVPDDIFASTRVDVRYVGEQWYAIATFPTEDGLDAFALTGVIGRLMDSSPTELFEFVGDEDKSHDAPVFFRIESDDRRELWAVTEQHNFELIGDYTSVSANQTEADFFFTRSTEVGGNDLWVTDGTTEGTVTVDIWPGSSGSNPEFVDWSGGTIVIADHPETGRELWAIEGSFAATPYDGLQAAIGVFDIIEGHALPLKVAANVATDLVVSWDLDNDGDFDDAVGSEALVTWEQLNEIVPVDSRENWRPIQARVEHDQVSSVALGFLRITNDEPQIHAMNVPELVRAGEAIEIDFDITDPADEHKLQYSIDLGDGSEPKTGSPRVTHTFDRMGVYDISVLVLDGDGGVANSTYQLTVEHESPEGAGMFAPGQVFGQSFTSVDLDIFDSTTDGYLDQLVVTQNDASNDRWSLDGDGRLVRESSAYSRNSSNASVFGFISDDWRIDEITASYNWLESGSQWQHQLGVVSEDVALGDFNGDQLLDIFVANSMYHSGEPAPDAVLLLDGSLRRGYAYSDGREFTPTGQELGAYRSLSVEVADIDDDGDLDAVTAALDSLHIWLNDGEGNFTETSQLNPGGKDLELGDLDGDGDSDIFVARAGANHVWLNDGLGAFVDSGHRLGAADSAAIALGDLDGDSDLDVFVANSTGEASRVWLNDGLAAFVDSEARIAASADSQAVTLADLNRDGSLDAIVGTAGAPNHVYINTSPAETPALPGDLDGDSTVSFADFLIMAANYGQQDSFRHDGDLNRDGAVTALDFRILAANFGRDLRD